MAIRNVSTHFKCQLKLVRLKKFSIRSKHTVLGIETSCDDTGIAVVRSDKLILGQALSSQQGLHLKYGGIIPPFAQNQHRKNIEKTFDACIRDAKIDIQNIDAIAVTNRPGLPLSLAIGVKYAKFLSRKFSKPLIPIHHMEAHALVARLEKEFLFPFLCLLVSGGHCQLVFVKNALSFYLLGESIDDAPGEAFDKIGRRLKLRNLPQYSDMNGGAAIEYAASQAQNTDRYSFPLPLTRYKNCQFSFAGLKNCAQRFIFKEEISNNCAPDEVIPHYKDFCASFLKGITRHICHRTQRAIEFCLRENMFLGSRTLVVSGGVACNDFIFNKISSIAVHFNFQIFRPSKNLCTDNGVMIAWNGIEKLLCSNSCLEKNIDLIDIEGKCSLGISLIDKVAEANISCKWLKIPY